ncbi:MAG: peptidylprolyl isomerase [Sneathiella sp.]
MKLVNFLAFLVVAGLSLAVGYFVGTDMKGLPGLEMGASATEESADPDDAVVASVDGTDIRESQVKRMFESLPEQYRQAPYAFIKGQLIEQLVNMRLVQNAAQVEKVDVDQEFLGRVSDVKLQLLQEFYLQQKIEAAVTDITLKAEYEKAIAEFKTVEEVSARHILLKEEAQAKDVIAKLDAGGDFVALAKEFSTGPSGPQGGDLGFFVKERMVPEFAEAAFKLEKGKYTAEAVKTQFGWHVIKLDDRRNTQPPAFDTMRKQLSDTLSTTTVTALIESLKAAATVNVVEPPKEKPAADAEPKKAE